MTRDEYLKALEAISDTDHIRGVMRVVNIALTPLWSYTAFKHPPEAAIEVVAETKLALGDLLRDFQEIDQYEEEQSDG